MLDGLTEILRPDTEAEAEAVIRDAAARGRTLRIQGGGTRMGLGRPVLADMLLCSAGLTGVTLHEPAELVLSARAGTPVSVVEAVLAAKGQLLPFEPVDLRMLYGTSGEPTIGGLVAGNWSGPRRVAVGAARDHVIGVRFINGRGETIKSGGRVMKNVTGLDLAKLMCGAQGTLGLMTEITFKVLPRAEAAMTMLYHGLDEHRAVQALTAALGSPFEVNGAAHLPAGIAASNSLTLLRMENFKDSLDYRRGQLTELLQPYGTPEIMDGDAAHDLWAQIRDAAFFREPAQDAVWRISVAPTRGPSLAGLIGRSLPGRCYYDWAGGLIWLATSSEGDAGAAAIRTALSVTGGHATLIRAPDLVRQTVDVFQPVMAPLEQLTAGLKASFDPQHILNPGLMRAVG